MLLCLDYLTPLRGLNHTNECQSNRAILELYYCHNANDDMRWLLALLSDSGRRLGEVVGLAIIEVYLDADIPHINITPHPWRRPKTKGSENMCSIGW